MKYKYIFLLIAAALIATNASAQRKKKTTTTQPKVEVIQSAADTLQVPDTALVVKNFIDSLRVLRNQLDSLEQVNAALQTEASDGRYYRLFAPTTFYHSGANKSLSLSPVTGDEVTDAVDDALMQLYLSRPDLVTNNESNLNKAGSIRDDVNKEMTQRVDLVDMAAPVPEEPEAVPVAVVVKKPNFWKFKAEGFLQFLQNYVSDNWYKGGESNYSAVGAATIDLNYNDKDRITFDNKLEMKLGFQTSRTDTVHRFKTNNDLIRFTSKLGLQAHKKWYYTLQLLAYTQFMRGYKANDHTVYSDFMSPFDLNIGLGMEYKVDAWKGRLTGSLNFLPASFNLRYVGREALATRYGLKENHKAKIDIGSQFTANLDWKLHENIAWKTRLFAYTSYHRALVEWENQIQLKVTKYISANLFLYPRFDDSNKRDEDLGYFQFQEYCSIGLNYTF